MSVARGSSDILDTQHLIIAALIFSFAKSMFQSLGKCFFLMWALRSGRFLGV